MNARELAQKLAVTERQAFENHRVLLKKNNPQSEAKEAVTPLSQSPKIEEKEEITPPSTHARVLAFNNIDEQIERINSPVYVRNIFAIQKGGFAKGLGGGEFNMPKKNSLPESRESVIQRIIQHNINMAEFAHAVHVDKNFIVSQDDKKSQSRNPPVMQKNKKNHITRLVFHEFANYPAEEIGPLNKQEFLLIINGIKQYAIKSFQANFHIVLGTFPVMDEIRKVYNMGLYLQCGKYPQITLFYKSFSSSVDIEYPKTVTPMLFGSAISPLLNKIRIQAYNICNKLFDQYRFQSVLAEEIQSLLMLCTFNRDYQPPQALINLLDTMVNSIESKLENFTIAHNFAYNLIIMLGLNRPEELQIFDEDLNSVINYIDCFKTAFNDPPLETLLETVKHKCQNSEDTTPEEDQLILNSQKIIKTTHPVIQECYLKKCFFSNQPEDISKFIEAFQDDPAMLDEFKPTLRKIYVGHKSFPPQTMDQKDFDVYVSARTHIQKSYPQYGLHENLISAYIQQNNKFFDSIRNNIQSSTPAIDIALPGLNFPFSHFITCQTPDGEAFTTAIDICLEHTFCGIAQTCIAQSSFLRNSSQDFMPLTTSHLVISNTTEVNWNHALTDIIEQADPRAENPHTQGIFYRNNPQKQLPAYIHTEEGVFGGTWDLFFYEPIKLSSLTAPSPLAHFTSRNKAIKEMKQIEVYAKLAREFPSLKHSYTEAMFLQVIDAVLSSLQTSTNEFNEVIKPLQKVQFDGCLKEEDMETTRKALYKISIHPKFHTNPTLNVLHTFFNYKQGLPKKYRKSVEATETLSSKKNKSL